MDAYAILPYKGLVEIASETGRELKLDLKIFEGETEEAIPFAMDAQKRGADCIISRGGTASIIERYVNVPIVRVPVSELDLLRILYPLKGLDRKILVVGFRNAVFRARSAARVLGLQIQELPIPYEAADYNFDHIRRSAEHLIRHHGIDTIIGDQTAFINLRSYCESQYLITSSKDDFLTALRNSQLLNTDGQREQQDQIQVVLNAVQEGIISTDTHGRVTSFNIKAAEIFGMEPGMVIGASLDELAGYFRDFEELKSTISLTLRNGNPESIQLSRPKGPEVYEINSAPLVSEKGIHGTVTTIIRSSHGHSGKSAGNKHPSAGTFNTHYSFKDILGRDEAFVRVLAVARAYSMTDATILLEGESGVGKEMFAQSIHASGPRKEGPFVAINCASIPEPLLESELFGYEQGAFTGASRAGQKGLFELADGGTLFLDEISEIDQKMQMNLLRVLEERRIRRIGSDRLRDVDVRVIAASNRDLRKLIDENHFRPDLFYRLNLLNLHIPALRERKADIPLLAEHFFTQFCRHYGGKEVRLTEDILNRLRSYPWPGNIRELKNIMERTALTIATRCLELSDLEIITRELNNSLSSRSSRINELSFCGTLNTIKRQAAESALQAAGYNKSHAARMLGIDRSTLDRLLDPRD